MPVSMPVTARRTLVLTLALSLIVPVLASAESYTITLRNGNTFRTRQQPQAAPWDAAKILFRTDAGNFISMASADVASVTTDSENRGFGRVLNSTTLMLGAAPNDLPTPAAPGTPEAAAAAAAAQTEGAADQGSAYSINQFVEPSQTQGIPGGWIGSSSSGGAGGTAPAPQPAPTPPPSGNQ